MKLIILSVIVVIGAILFFIGGETGKEVTRGLISMIQKMLVVQAV